MIDDLLGQIERDELLDAELLTPRNFAKLIGVAPQLIYYHIRTGLLETEVCPCGRRVLRTALALQTLQEAKVARGEVMDTDPDELRQGLNLQDLSPSDQVEGLDL